MKQIKFPCKNSLKDGSPCEGANSHAIHNSWHPEYHEYMKDAPVGIQPMSAGMRAFRKASGYDQAVREAEGKPCQVMSPVCTGYAEHLHEILPRGRAGGLRAALRDGDTVICCDACNGYISEHPVWAYEKGWLKHSWGDQGPGQKDAR